MLFPTLSRDSVFPEDQPFCPRPEKLSFTALGQTGAGTGTGNRNSASRNFDLQLNFVLIFLMMMMIMLGRAVSRT
jgi:hypothetical protein